MSDADQLYSLLQVGSSRAAGVRPAALPPELAAILPPNDAPGDATEAQLWLSLAAWSLWSRAGLRPANITRAAPDAAPAEHLRPCPAGAEALLARLLQGGHKAALLREWLRGLKRYGGRIPARFLPNLLALGTRHAELRAEVLPVLGARGQWLSRLDAAWEWAAPAVGQDGLALWETGSLEQRHAALLQWRAEDPAAAREALAESWSSEAPELRARLLPCLAVNLGPDDEAFLEAALDDRRKEVRLAAQAVLVKLPGSGLRRRLQARAEPLLRIKRPLLGRAGLELSLPEAIDKAMARDGVGAASHPGLGEKAGWVVDLLAATDPRDWSARLETPPGELLLMARRNDFAHALVRGWSSAVVRGAASPQELTEWVHALLVFWLSSDAPMRHQYPRDFFDLLSRMAPGDLHAWLADVVGASRRSWGESELVLLDLLVQAAEHSPAPWPAALSREVVERLLKDLPSIQNAQWVLRSALDSLSGIVDPPAVTALEAAWRARGLEGGIHDHIAQFFDTVRFRHEMSHSFQEPA